MIRKYHNQKLQTNSDSNDSSPSPASPWRLLNNQMLAKTAMRRCISHPHGKIYCIYIGLNRVISKAFINKLAHIKICRCKNLRKYIIFTFAVPSELYYNCYNLLGRPYNWINCYIKCIYIYFLYCRKKFIFMILKCTCRSNTIHMNICKKIIGFRDFCTQWPFNYSCQCV